MSLDPNIQNFDSSIQGPTYIAPADYEKVVGNKKGESDIATSEAVAALFILLPNFPILTPPKDDNTFNTVIGTIVVGGSNPAEVAKFLAAEQLKLAEITNNVADAWSRNLKEIQEEVQKLVNSPQYQELQLIQARGDPKQGNVSGIENVTAANAVGMNPTAGNVQPLSLVSAIDRLHAFERVPPPATIPDPADPTDATKTLTIPLVGAMVIGGALALGSVNLATTVNGFQDSPMLATVELVERLQPALPQLMPEIIPMINLMVMPLVYYTSWDNAIGSLRNKEAANNLNMIQDFAKQVIKMVSDPTFILNSIVNRMDGADAMSSERKDVLTATLKLILASVGLSLLYSFDVGKVQNGQFWGMEPQEFQGMLSGQIPVPDPSDPATAAKLTTQAQLTATILGLVRAQLNVIPSDDRANVLAVLFDYIPNSRDLQKMLDPNKVFRDVFNSTLFNLGLASLESNPA